MTDERKDGGGAFPVRTGHYSYSKGMTLRDYFAAKAMAACISAHHVSENHTSDPDSAAEWAYAFADAMIAEREKL